MIVGSYQPYFAPFPGFFAKACLADVLVLYDTVQFHNPQPYPQLYGPGILNLSAFDLLFCCGPMAPRLLRKWIRDPRLQTKTGTDLFIGK